MRRLLLALCLLLQLAVPAVAQTPEREPPRDLVVPQGAEGLSPETALDMAVEAVRRGDTVRARELMRFAAELGEPDAAHLFAIETYTNRTDAWRADLAALGETMLAADPASVFAHLWLGLAHDPKIADAALADTLSAHPTRADLFYRAFALGLLWSWENRADLQRILLQMQIELFEGGPLPDRVAAAFGWVQRIDDSDPASLVALFRRECGGSSAPDPLVRPWLYCFRLARMGADARAPDALYEAARLALEVEIRKRRFASNWEIEEWLCRSAEAGKPAAAVLLAEWIVGTDFVAFTYLPRLAYLIEGLAPERKDLVFALVAEMDAGDRMHYTRRYRGPESDHPLRCLPWLIDTERP